MQVPGGQSCGCSEARTKQRGILCLSGRGECAGRSLPPGPMGMRTVTGDPKGLQLIHGSPQHLMFIPVPAVHTNIISNAKAMWLQLKKLRDHPHVGSQGVFHTEVGRHPTLRRLFTQPNTEICSPHINGVCRIDSILVVLTQARQA